MGRALTAALVLGLLAASARAESRPLSWSDAVSLALSKSPDLAAAVSGRDAQVAGYRGSFNSLLPALSLSNSLSDSKGATGQSRWGADASVSMNLFDAGRIAEIRRSAATRDSASARLWQTSAGLRFDLRRSFLNLLLAQENVSVSELIAERRRRGAKLVALRYESGRESLGNMLRTRAQALQAEEDLAQTTRDLRTARRSLTRQIGLEKFELLAATGTLAVAEPPALPADEDTLLAARPELAVQEAAVRGAQAGLSSARSAFIPELSARYSRSVSGPTEFPRRTFGWSAGATLSLPLFGGGPTAAYYDISSARSSLDQARHELRAARGQALLDIENAWSDFARASAQSRVQAALLDAARQRSDEADVRYASGLLSYDNWEIISTDRVNQERQALAARLNAAVAEAGWERALGRRLGERE